ncbi:MAG TPA: hypothetical protein EYP80_02320 [Candidatus Aenigmarchaeota archaeon]|nr:hypothetical protein [Candidatus Aenigmarchaeota archaeon]
MKEVFEISKEKEQKIKKDELLAKQSLIFREIEGKYYLIIDGDEEAINKLKGEFNLKIAENKDEISKKVNEEEEKAIQGFGGIFS